jgi:hypothetical protein
MYHLELVPEPYENILNKCNGECKLHFIAALLQVLNKDGL